LVGIGFRGATSSSRDTTCLTGALVRRAEGAAFFPVDFPVGLADFVTDFFFATGLDFFTATRFLTVFLTAVFLTAVFLTAFFFAGNAAFFLLDAFFVTAFFFLFAIPVPPLRFSAARRPPSSMNERPLATTSLQLFERLDMFAFLRIDYHLGSSTNTASCIAETG
jgi:hypothetical protein